jgi:hypothetical protein
MNTMHTRRTCAMRYKVLLDTFVSSTFVSLLDEYVSIAAHERSSEYL